MTICVREMKFALGDIIDATVRLNGVGQVVVDSWLWLKKQYSFLELDEWIVMPNHIHGIIILHEAGRGGSRTAPTKLIRRKPLGRIIGAYKTISTKKINQIQGSPGKTFWQRGYYDRIIRDERELIKIRKYILENPIKWELDEYHPSNLIE